MFSSLTLNNIAKGLTSLIVLGFFIAGLLDILDYVIVKLLLFGSTGSVLVIILIILFRDNKKNRSEEEPQNDFN